MTASKIVAAAASGVAEADPVDVAEVFNTTLYEGNGSDKTITNDIDLSGKGGLVWIKKRNGAESHILIDTERGVSKYIKSDLSDVESTTGNTVSTFNSNGFIVGNYANTGANNNDYVAWTFRKQKKFFDVVTYTGNGLNARTVSHNLGVAPGMIMTKNTSGSTADWQVYHIGMNGGTNPHEYFMSLNEANGEATSSVWNNTAPTSTQFTVSSGAANTSGNNYVAYLFAHNEDDPAFGAGDFGPDKDQDIIKCGHFSGSNSGVTVNLGFQPQWLLFKRRDGSGGWGILDEMRGVNLTTVAQDNCKQIRANINNAENQEYNPHPVYNGFATVGAAGGGAGGSDDYIYVAIRRGPLNIPTDATKFFMPYYSGSGNLPGITVTGFPPDFFINTQTSGAPKYSANRLTAGASGTSGKYLSLNSTSNANNGGSGVEWFNNSEGTRAIDFYTSWYGASGVVSGNIWRRAPNYFDIGHYYGNGGGVSAYHNLGVAPEMVWIKRRDASQDWGLYHNSGSGTECAAVLNSTDAMTTSSLSFTRQADRIVVYDSGFPIDLSINGADYIVYFFVTCPGVSKCGVYTGNNSTNTVDCGFSSGARFVLIKQRSSEGSSTQRGVFVFDTARGIVSGNDNFYKITSSNTADTTDQDWIDPHSSGFQLTSAGGNDVNANGRQYMFYAVT